MLELIPFGTKTSCKNQEMQVTTACSKNTKKSYF